MKRGLKRIHIQPMLLICAHCMHFGRFDGASFCCLQQVPILYTHSACKDWIDSIYGTDKDGLVPSTPAPEKETSRDTDCQQH